jgi:hypothetical protein
MMKSLASQILFAALTTMSGIRFSQGRVIIDRIAKKTRLCENNGGLPKNKVVGKGSPERLVY